MTAICGTAIQAHLDGSKLAVFVVHEFQTNKTVEEKVRKNAEDFNTFMVAICSLQEAVEEKVLYGPVTVGGMDCLIGKVVKYW